MSKRAIWKGPFICLTLLKQSKAGISFKPIRVWSRNSIIFPSFVGLSFEVYNGKKFVMITIKQNMVGAKFGEFVLTRKLAKHKQKN